MADPTTNAIQHRHVKRQWIFVVGTIVLIGGAIAGYFALRSDSKPPALVPPDPQGEHLEQSVLLAIKAMRERVLKEPESANAWGSLGEAFLGNEIEEEARICFVEAERLEPGNPRWPYFQGIISVNRGDRVAAIPYFQRAVERGQQEPEANRVTRIVLAETLHFLGKPDQAGDYVLEVLAADPQNVRAHFLAGLIAIGREEWETARAHLLKCLGSPFARQRARIQLAAVSLRLGDAGKAEELQQEANRLPADADWFDPYIREYLEMAVKKKSRYKLAESLEASGRFAEAARILGPMTREFPDDDMPHLMFGRQCARLGDYVNAEKSLRRALLLAPQKVQAHYFLSLMLVMKGDSLEGQNNRAQALACFEEADARARKALELKPDYGLAHMALGLALKRRDKLLEAAAELQEAVRCTPEHSEIHWQLAEVLFEQGKFDEARRRYEYAIQNAPPGTIWTEKAKERLNLIAAKKTGNGMKK